jgi:hypothetical protein
MPRVADRIKRTAWLWCYNIGFGSCYELEGRARRADGLFDSGPPILTGAARIAFRRSSTCFTRGEQGPRSLQRTVQ